MTRNKMVRGIRGATTVADNEADLIYNATCDLLHEMIEKNKIDSHDIAAVFFSATPDLNAAFPAKAARDIGWVSVPLFCQVEIDVPESLERCIRVLIMINTCLTQDKIKHVYLKEAVNLRKV